MDKWFVCLKWGDKYGAEYVNTLHSMFKRNASSDIRFACYTDDSTGINNDIEIFQLPNLNLQGWWNKVYFLSPDLPTQGTLLFCDLDVIIFRSIDKFFDYKPGQFCICRDFNRHIVKGWDKMNSSVFRIDTGSQAELYNQFIKNPRDFMKVHGDQDFMYKHIKDFEFWPDEWAQSYKWEMRGKPKLVGLRGNRNFESPGEPTILDETSIAVFHGEPNPKDCIDNWTKENWK